MVDLLLTWLVKALCKYDVAAFKCFFLVQYKFTIFKCRIEGWGRLDKGRKTPDALIEDADCVEVDCRQVTDALRLFV